ncbi:MAG: hypothetical protein LAP13_20480 [Acidobacteriia bacterium]|nr:hypothetical protein [Terriglobia bacterium]
MAEARTAAVKYVFLDVVNYSQDRSVEAQTDIVGTLNQLVRTSTEEFGLPSDRVIFLPTGDGICIALVGVESPYDVHLQLALKLLESLDTFNSQAKDPMREFAIRIGINQNVDNLVTDVNERANVAGAGINIAQRVMSAGDANQVLVGQAVYETLRHRQKYMKSFRSYTSRTKHGQMLRVHQYIDPHKGLSVSTPAQFRPADQEQKLTKFAGYYLANAIKNRDSLLQCVARGGGAFSAVVLLAHLAEDCVGYSEATDIDPYESHTWGARTSVFLERFDHYNSIDFWVTCDLARFIKRYYLSGVWKYFDSGRVAFDAHFVTAEGREKLKQDWPDIWEEFGFDKE